VYAGNSLVRFREHSWDETIYDSVVKENEYRLPDDLTSQMVVDIGAHIGSFALACHQRGAGKIACYEPDPENFELLTENAGGFATCVNAAVMGAPTTNIGIRRLREDDADRGRNTGHVDVYGAPDGTVGVGIQAVLREHGPIDVLKIDCEGAEWDIFEMGDFSRVARIVGELHMPPTSSHPLLAHLQRCSFNYLVGRVTDKLRAGSFEVNVTRTTSTLASILATRQASSP
jgi:FkbM family methyltransferase